MRLGIELSRQARTGGPGLAAADASTPPPMRPRPRTPERRRTLPPSLVLTASPGPTSASDGVALGPAIQFGPSGTQFAVPVAVTVPYDASLLAGDVTVTVLRREDDTQEVTGLASGLADCERRRTAQHH